jgi:hypothetical protein
VRAVSKEKDRISRERDNVRDATCKAKLSVWGVSIYAHMNMHIAHMRTSLRMMEALQLSTSRVTTCNVYF